MCLGTVVIIMIGTVVIIMFPLVAYVVCLAVSAIKLEIGVLATRTSSVHSHLIDETGIIRMATEQEMREYLAANCSADLASLMDDIRLSLTIQDCQGRPWDYRPIRDD